MKCIVSAVSLELNPLIKKLGGSWDSGGNFIDKAAGLIFSKVGIGFLDAFANTTRLLDQFPEITSFLFTGSAGFYSKNATAGIGDTCSCQDTFICDGAAELGLSDYVTKGQKAYLKSTLPLNMEIPALRVATVFTITIKNSLANTIAEKRQADVENMELFGVALACQKKKTPWNAILGITNEVGDQGREQWLKHKDEIAAICCQYVSRWIR